MERRVRAVAFILVLILWHAGTAWADGTIEINQACVANGCFSGDGPGFPVEINEPGVYRLTSQLSVPDDQTSAILVSATAFQVQLDLGGFVVLGPRKCVGEPVTDCTGPTTFQPRGIRFDSGPRSVIQNGRVSGFYAGIDCRDCEIVNVRVDNNSNSGVMAEGVIVRNSILERNRFYGLLYFGGSGLGMLLENNAIRFNGYWGIRRNPTSGVSRGLVRFNIIGDNSQVSEFGSEMIYGNSFNEASTPPFSGGISAGNNNCNGALC